jgi:hypothetical protein
MKPFESIEEELRRRDPGWWDRIVHNIPELDTLAGTPQLLHDVGKPLVTKDEDDKITAHGHHAVGAEIAERILELLQMEPARTERILWAIRHHTFHLSWNLTAPEQASQRHRRFVADQRFPLLLELLRVDSAASLGHPRGMQAYELYSRLRKSVVEDNPAES